MARRPDRDPGPLRVVLVIGTLERGGTEWQLVSLATGLHARGCEVTVLCLEKAGALSEGVRAQGIDVEEARFSGLSPILNPLPLIRIFRSIYSCFGRRRPDVVHCFLYWGGLLGVPLARLAGVPVVVGSRRSLTHAIRRNRALRPWEIVAHRWSDAIVCNSEAVRDDAIREGKVAARKTRVILNGVQVPAALPVPRVAVTPGPVRILVVANLIAYKGHAVLLDAFAGAARRVGLDAMRLRLAGSGPEEGALRAKAARLGVLDRVDFLGSVADVGPLLRECRFTVLPSLSEGMPNAVLESLAAGRPVIASRVGGVPEILGHGGGIMVPPGDPAALADAICRLVLDPQAAAALGAKGPRIVEPRFGMDRMVEETLQLYAELLAARGASVRPPAILERGPQVEAGI